MKADYSRHLELPEEFDVQSECWAGDENMALVAQIAERIPRGCSLMDVGAGSGAAIPAWLTKAHRVVAVDSCSRACQHLRGNFECVTVVEADVRSILRSNVDVVVCKATLKHFGPEWRSILRRLFDLAQRRVIFTMGVGDEEGDRNPDVPYYDWAAPMKSVVAAIPDGWELKEYFGNGKEPVFVCDKKA